MTLLRYGFFVIVIMLTVSCSQSSHTVARSERIETLVPELMQWILDHPDASILHKPKRLPSIVFVSRNQLGGEITDGNKMVMGFYDISSEEKHIYIINTWRPNLTYTAYLLHEIVHYVQDASGLYNTRCWGANEKLAYDLQNAWLREQGYPESKIMPYPEKAIMELYPC